MNYIIYKDGVEENRILADEEFCRTYYSADGYSYQRAPDPEPAPKPEPEPEESGDMDLMAAAYLEGVRQA